MSERVYVCHTYYHVYVTFLKEFALRRKGDDKRADLVLSTISTIMEDAFVERLRDCGIFGNVFVADEKKDTFFPELMAYKKDTGNIILNMKNRIIYTRLLGDFERPYFSEIDFKAYKDVYVYCDSDPIGYYLSRQHIYYHALEDGLDTLKYQDSAYYDNRGFFKLKTLMSRLNLIFIQNGWGKYCLDMEVNDFSCLRRIGRNYKEVPRKPLEKELTSEQKAIILKAFMEDGEAFASELKDKPECILFLTMPHPKEEEKRELICNDIIRDYCEGYHVVIKPHPRDTVDYARLRPDCSVVRGRFPVEVLNFIPGVHFKKIISIATTAMDTLDFADEKINLGDKFWDKYEDPSKHNWRYV